MAIVAFMPGEAWPPPHVDNIFVVRALVVALALRFNWKSFSILIKTFYLMQNAVEIIHNVQHLHHNSDDNNKAAAKVLLGQQQNCRN